MAAEMHALQIDQQWLSTFDFIRSANTHAVASLSDQINRGGLVCLSGLGMTDHRLILEYARRQCEAPAAEILTLDLDTYNPDVETATKHIQFQALEALRLRSLERRGLSAALESLLDLPELSTDLATASLVSLGLSASVPLARHLFKAVGSREQAIGVLPVPPRTLFLETVSALASRQSTIIHVPRPELLPLPVGAWLAKAARAEHRLTVVYSNRSPGELPETRLRTIDVRPLDASRLRAVLARSRFSPADFPKAFYEALCEAGAGSPALVAGLFDRLLKNELVMGGNAGQPWRLSAPLGSPQIGSALGGAFIDRIDAVVDGQRFERRQTRDALAACAFFPDLIPLGALLEHFGVSADRRTGILAGLERSLGEASEEPILLRVPLPHPDLPDEPLYRFTKPLARAAMLADAYEQIGPDTLLEIILSLQSRWDLGSPAVGRMLAGLADHLDDSELPDFDHLLQWWISSAEATELTEYLADQLERGATSWEPLLLGAYSVQNDWPTYRRLAVLKAGFRVGTGIPPKYLSALNIITAAVLVDAASWEEAIDAARTGLRLDSGRSIHNRGLAHEEIASALIELGKPRRAWKHIQVGLSVAKQVHGLEHHHTCRVLHLAVRCSLAVGDVVRAEHYLDGADAIPESAIGASDLCRGHCLRAQLVLMKWRSRRDPALLSEASARFDSAMVEEQSLGRSMGLHLAMKRIADHHEALLALNRPAEAHDMATALLTRMVREFGPADARVKRVRRMMGVV